MPDFSVMAELGELQWRQPLMLLLALQPLLLWARAWWLARRAVRQQAQWLDRSLWPWVLVDAPKAGLADRFSLDRRQLVGALAWLLLGLAAAGPRLPPVDAGASDGADQDLVLLVDLSRSMAATDIAPSRLRRATIELQELLLRAPAARVAVLVYAGRSHVLVPPTTDHAALAFYLRQLDRLPMPTSGSRSAAALQQALDTAIAMRQQRRQKGAVETGSTVADASIAAVIWLTDADSSALQPPLDAAATRFADADVVLSMLALGSYDGAAIPLADGSWLQQQGRAVVSRMDSDEARRIVAIAGGSFSLAHDDDRDWQLLYDRAIAAKSARSGAVANGPLQWRQLYQWPLALALLLLWIQRAAWPRWHRSPRHSSSSAPGTAPMVTLGVVLSAALLLGSASRPLQAADGDSDIHWRLAHAHYAAGEFGAAAAAYARLPGYAGRMGEGSGYFRSENFGRAAAQFRRALLLAADDRDRADALYNLGNALFRSGFYGQASEAFGDALRYNPELENSRFNLELSTALDDAVQSELRRRRGERLAGTALLAARVEAEAELGDQAFVSEGDSTMPELGPLLPDLPDPELDRDAVNALAASWVERGLAAQQAADASRWSSKAPDPQRARQNLIEARLRMAELEDQQLALWKRLFEMEEGFPAPLAEPLPLPDVPPW